MCTIPGTGTNTGNVLDLLVNPKITIHHEEDVYHNRKHFG